MFDLVRGQTPDTISKPDPRSLWDLLRDLKVEREACVYVGDTDVDMQLRTAARAPAGRCAPSSSAASRVAVSRMPEVASVTPRTLTETVS